MKRRRNPKLKSFLPALAILGVAAVAVIEGPKLGLFSPGGSHPTAIGPFADPKVLLAANPNILSQASLWQSERKAKGQDPLDWGAFRIHVQALGAPDPGSLPFSAFFPMVS
jgi:hypothetical protein